MSLVKLIGTYHGELLGWDLASNALEEISPEIIVSESNEFLDLKSARKFELWEALFDEYDIPTELRAKFWALSTDKEHLAGKKYSQDNNIPFYMVDMPKEVYEGDVKIYSRETRVKEFRKESTPDKLTDMINLDWDLAFNGQKPPNPLFYSDDYLIPRMQGWIGERDVHMAEKIAEVIEKHPDKRICGFFGQLHLMDTQSDKVIAAVGKGIRNIRSILGTKIDYGILLDYVNNPCPAP